MMNNICLVNITVQWTQFRLTVLHVELYVVNVGVTRNSHSNFGMFPLFSCHYDPTVPELFELLEFARLFLQTLDINFLRHLFFDHCTTLNKQKTNFKRNTFSAACTAPLKVVFKIIGNYLNETLNIFIKT